MTNTKHESNRVTFGLPVQSFRITAHISIEKRLPIVTEFVLRLLHTMGEVTLSGLRDYFGFTDPECVAVVDGLTTQGYIKVVEDRLSLSEQMAAKFAESPQSCPWIPKLQRRTDVVPFDLLTFSPLAKVDFNPGSENWVKLGVDEEMAGASIARARDAYRSSFAAIQRKEARQGGRERERSYGVHSIEHVEAKKPSFLPVSTDFALTANDEFTFGFPAVFENEAPQVLVERMQERIHETLDRGSPGGSEALQEFFDLFDVSFMLQYVVGTRFDFCGYARAVADGAHRTDCLFPLFGASYLQRNVENLAALIHEAREAKGFSSLAWLAPESIFWGRGDAFKAAVSSFRRSTHAHYKDDDVYLFDYAEEHREPATRGKYVGTGVTALHLLRPGLNAKAACLPHLELLLYPTTFCAAFMHLPLEPGSKVRVPIGFASTEPRHVRTVHTLMWSQMAGDRYAGHWSTSREQKRPPQVSVEDACGFLCYSNFEPGGRKKLVLKRGD